MTIMQGDSYKLSIQLCKADKSNLTPTDVNYVEISIGRLTKNSKNGAVTYDSENGLWLFPLTQEEAFNMYPGTPVKAQARVKWLSGDVEGIDLGMVSVYESISKEVLS